METFAHFTVGVARHMAGKVFGNNAQRIGCSGLVDGSYEVGAAHGWQ